MTVLDYSDWRPQSPQLLRQHGVTGVMRYIAPAAWHWPKAIAIAELHGLLTAGIEVGFNFEKNPTDYQSGAQGGRENRPFRMQNDEAGEREKHRPRD